jgi:glucose/mannose transport system permease protein
MSTVLQAGEARVEAAPRFPRRPKGISGRSIAILVFLSICAAFF